MSQVLPAHDRVWSEALLAELEDVPAKRRMRWLMGLMPLLVQRAWRHFWGGDVRSSPRDPTTRGGAWLGLAAGTVIAAGLAWSNLGPSARHPESDPEWATLVAYAVLACLFVAIGFVGRGRGREVAECGRAALACAVVLTVITFLTVIVIDNAWLSTVARQPDKIYGLRHSGLFHGMRAYVDAMDLVGLVVAIPLGAAVSAALGAVGALVRGRPGGRPQIDRGTAA